MDQNEIDRLGFFIATTAKRVDPPNALLPTEEAIALMASFRRDIADGVSPLDMGLLDSVLASAMRALAKPDEGVVDTDPAKPV